MQPMNGEVNFNKLIGESTEQATEIKLRCEIAGEGGSTASDIWRVQRDKFRAFAKTTGQIGEKFAFTKYQYDIICLMAHLLDEATTAGVTKVK